jgi:hypothetical protein
MAFRSEIIDNSNVWKKSLKERTQKDRETGRQRDFRDRETERKKERKRESTTGRQKDRKKEREIRMDGENEKKRKYNQSPVLLWFDLQHKKAFLELFSIYFLVE